MCSPDFAEFSVLWAGLATTFHHNFSTKTCHSRHKATLFHLGGQPSILAGPLNRMLDCLFRLHVEASERACAAGEAYFCVLVLDCSPWAVPRANPITAKVRTRRRFRLTTPRSSSTNRPPRLTRTTPLTRSSSTGYAMNHVNYT